jgi:Copper transport outer membrane protein, MctB
VISFRYHLVSIIAVFLALALGIVVGTTALNGPITSNLRGEVDTLRKDRTSLSSQVSTLQGEVDDGTQFATTYGPQIVKGSLTDKSVLVVGLPGANTALKDSLGKQIVAAGGKISGRIQLTSDYSDPKRASDLTALATGNAHPVGMTLPNTDDAGVLGGYLLSWVLLGKGESTDIRSVLTGLAGLHMLKVESSGDVAPANLVVVVANGTIAAGDAVGKAQLALVSQLAQLGGKVEVAGDTASSTGGGVIALVRGDDAEKSTVSTVDNADSSLGQVSAILALDALTKAQVGHFGTGSGASKLYPQAAS